MNEILEVVKKAETHLRQQKMLVGEVFYAEKPRRTYSELSNSPKSEQLENELEVPFVLSQKISKKESINLKNKVEKLETKPDEFVPELWKNATSLIELFAETHLCQKCPLGQSRTKFVFGVGNPNADVMIIGEAPGADEDLQGEPFVGSAGQLLTKILAAINFHREDVFIANILKCRPPNNRKPELAEVEQCEPYLFKQIELVKPRLILALGLTAVNTLLKTEHKMGEIRGQQIPFHGAIMIPTYHPAALLRNPAWKTATWEDVKLLRRLYDEGK